MRIIILILFTFSFSLNNACKRSRLPATISPESAASDAELEDLRKEKEDLEQKLTEERLAQSERLMTLQDEREDLIAERTAFEMDIANIEKVLEDQTELSSSEKAALNFQLVAAQAGRQEVQDSLEKNTEELEKAHNRIKELNAEIETLKAKISELESRIIELEKELAEERAKNLANGKSDGNSGTDPKQNKILLSDDLRKDLSNFERIGLELQNSKDSERILVIEEELLVIESMISLENDANQKAILQLKSIDLIEEKDTLSANLSSQKMAQKILLARLKTNLDAWETLNSNYPEFASSGAIAKSTLDKIREITTTSEL